MARTLAEHGAEVSKFLTRKSSRTRACILDPCVGFRSCRLDLNQPEARPEGPRPCRRRRRVRGELQPQNFQPGTVARGTGRSPPGDGVRVGALLQLCGRGRTGRLRHEALCVTGFAVEKGTPDRPAFPPTHVMNDFVAGYLGAAGIQAALIRRAREGGSYHVRVNLARCAMRFMRWGSSTRTPRRSRRAAPDPGAGHHHRPNPLRGARPSPTLPGLRDEGILGRPGADGAWREQTAREEPVTAIGLRPGQAGRSRRSPMSSPRSNQYQTATARARHSGARAERRGYVRSWSSPPGSIRKAHKYMTSSRLLPIAVVQSAWGSSRRFRTPGIVQPVRVAATLTCR